MIQTSVVTLILLAFSILSTFVHAAEFTKGESVLVRCGYHYYKGEITRTTRSGKLKVEFENLTQKNFCGMGFKNPEKHTVIKYQQTTTMGDFSIGSQVLASCSGYELEATITDLATDFIKLEFAEAMANKLCGQGYKVTQDEIDGERLELLN